MRKKLRLLCVCIAMIMLSTPVFAASDRAGIGTNANTADAMEMVYGSQSWRVIGFNGTGVASEAGTMTLFAKNYIASSGYPDGTSMFSSNNNRYSESNLKTAIENGAYSGFSNRERAAILTRTLFYGGYIEGAPYSDGIAGAQVDNAALWPLSTAEVYHVDSELRKANASTHYWLRSPGFLGGYVATGSPAGVFSSVGWTSANIYGIRPAFRLNLSSVLLTSAAVSGKSDTPTANLATVVVPSGVQKLTIIDSGLSSGTVTATGTSNTMGSSIRVYLTGASANKSVSGIIADSTGEVAKYYGKIGNTNGAGTASGINMILPVTLDAENVLKIFVEEINGDNLTDYASAPQTVEIDPPAAPTVVGAVINTAGNTITIEFNKEMANPAGKHGQFSFNDGGVRAFSAAALNIDPRKIDLTVDGAAIANGASVTVSYTAGDVIADDDGVLATFSNQAVTNNVPETINIPAIPGVTAPVTGDVPVTTITETAQYTGTVSWAPAHNPFQGSVEYTATITLTPKAGYTLTGVSENFFTAAGANTVANAASAGVVTAVFPATAAATIDIAAIPGVTAPVTGAAPVTTITETAQYTGTVSWAPAHDPFQVSTEYTATITLTPKAGYTLTGVSENFFTVAGANTVANAANSGEVTAVFPAAAEGTIDMAAIPGVTVPVTGAAPVTTITETAQYTGTVSWAPAHNPFQVSTDYTATITLTPKAGYTLTGVSENFFAVAGANTVTNAANSGVVTATFPAVTAGTIDIAAIPGVTAPVTGDVPVTTITETAQYTGTVLWAPAHNPFQGGTEYTATIILTSKAGFILTGVSENFFTVAGANTVANAANSGVVTAVFPATAAGTIDIAAIPGVTAPVTGDVPVTTITETAQYTGTVSWAPAHNPFQVSTDYTATITLTPKAGYTLTGVAENFFAVAGANTVANDANSGEVTAVFPATAASGGGGGGGSGGGTSRPTPTPSPTQEPGQILVASSISHTASTPSDIEANNSILSNQTSVIAYEPTLSRTFSAGFLNSVNTNLDAIILGNSSARVTLPKGSLNNNLISLVAYPDNEVTVEVATVPVTRAQQNAGANVTVISAIQINMNVANSGINTRISQLSKPASLTLNVAEYFQELGVMTEASRAAYIRKNNVMVAFIGENGPESYYPVSYVNGEVTATGISHFSTYGVVEARDTRVIRMSIDSLNTTINNEAKFISVPPTIRDNCTLIPLRFVAEALGAKVDWIEATRTVTVELNGMEIALVIGNKGPGLDVPAQIIDGQVMVPIRYISEQLGARVNWNELTRVVEVIKQN